MIAVLQERVRLSRLSQLEGERPDVEREHVAQAQEAGRRHRREQRRLRMLIEEGADCSRYRGRTVTENINL